MHVHYSSFFVISDRPNEDEIKANINTTSDEVFAVVIFQKVYPQPK